MQNFSPFSIFMIHRMINVFKFAWIIKFHIRNLNLSSFYKNEPKLVKNSNNAREQTQQLQAMFIRLRYFDSRKLLPGETRFAIVVLVLIFQKTMQCRKKSCLVKCNGQQCYYITYLTYRYISTYLHQRARNNSIGTSLTENLRLRIYNFIEYCTLYRACTQASI